jgi:hypothetical protein
MSSPNDVPAILDRLVTAWCARRALAPLRYILPAYPPAWNLTDECYRLLEAMKEVRGLSRDSLTEEENRDLTRAIILLQDALEKRRS